MSKIKVNNKSNMKIDVAISHWGSDGDTNFFTINSNESANWSRGDSMGFIMVITEHNANRKDGSYWYVQANKEIYVNSLNEVTGALQGLKNPIK